MKNSQKKIMIKNGQSTGLVVLDVKHTSKQLYCVFNISLELMIIIAFKKRLC